MSYIEELVKYPNQWWKELKKLKMMDNLKLAQREMC